MPKKPPSKKKNASKKVDPYTSRGKALETFNKLPPSTQALDASRRSRKVQGWPTEKWAQDPTKSDVRGIDDGSHLAKDLHRKVIKDHFREMAKKSAEVRKAKAKAKKTTSKK